MPDAKVEEICDLVWRARNTFVSQLLKTNPTIVGDEHEALAAFNNAIVELVSLLEKSCNALRDTADDNRRARTTLEEVRVELAEVQNLGQRHSFSATDPVCARCAALVAEANPGGNRAQFRIAVEGDACSKCGAVVRHR